MFTNQSQANGIAVSAEFFNKNEMALNKNCNLKLKSIMIGEL